MRLRNFFVIYSMNTLTLLAVTIRLKLPQPLLDWACICAANL